MKSSIGADCPRCGKPQTFSLASPDTFVCDACQYTAPHPPALAAQLREAARLLWAVEANAKQFGAWQRGALRLSGWAFGLYMVVSVLLLIPTMLAMGCTCVHVAQENARGAMLVGLPALIVPLGALIGSLFLYKARTRLLEQCSALPPLAPGGTARCRACGAPMTATGRHLVVRCDFCGTDNLVDSRVLGWLGSRVHQTTNAVRLMQQRGAVAVGSGVLGLVVLPLFSLIGPLVVTFGVLVFNTFVLDAIENPADLQARYVLETVPAVGLQCYGTVSPDGKTIGFGFPPREAGLPDMPYDRKVSDGERLVLQDARSLVGRRVCIGSGIPASPFRSESAKVIRVFRPPMSKGNTLKLLTDQGWETTRHLWPTNGANFLCLPSEPEGKNTYR